MRPVNVFVAAHGNAFMTDIASWIVEAAALLGHGTTVQATHQALADELGTVREIVTRLLKRFERAGWVAMGRERIDVRDAMALRAVAAGAAPQR